MNQKEELLQSLLNAVKQKAENEKSKLKYPERFISLAIKRKDALETFEIPLEVFPFQFFEFKSDLNGEHVVNAEVIVESSEKIEEYKGQINSTASTYINKINKRVNEKEFDEALQEGEEKGIGKIEKLILHPSVNTEFLKGALMKAISQNNNSVAKLLIQKIDTSDLKLVLEKTSKQIFSNVKTNYVILSELLNKSLSSTFSNWIKPEDLMQVKNESELQAYMEQLETDNDKEIETDNDEEIGEKFGSIVAEEFEINNEEEKENEDEKNEKTDSQPAIPTPVVIPSPLSIPTINTKPSTPVSETNPLPFDSLLTQVPEPKSKKPKKPKNKVVFDEAISSVIKMLGQDVAKQLNKNSNPIIVESQLGEPQTEEAQQGDAEKTNKNSNLDVAKPKFNEPEHQNSTNTNSQSKKPQAPIANSVIVSNTATLKQVEPKSVTPNSTSLVSPSNAKPTTPISADSSDFWTPNPMLANNPKSEPQPTINSNTSSTPIDDSESPILTSDNAKTPTLQSPVEPHSTPTQAVTSEPTVIPAPLPTPTVNSPPASDVNLTTPLPTPNSTSPVSTSNETPATPASELQPELEELQPYNQNESVTNNNVSVQGGNTEEEYDFFSVFGGNEKEDTEFGNFEYNDLESSGGDLFELLKNLQKTHIRRSDPDEEEREDNMMEEYKSDFNANNEEIEDELEEEYMKTQLADFFGFNETDEGWNDYEQYDGDIEYSRTNYEKQENNAIKAF